MYIPIKGKFYIYSERTLTEGQLDENMDSIVSLQSPGQKGRVRSEI
jgi:hypothetical protein